MPPPLASRGVSGFGFESPTEKFGRAMATKLWKSATTCLILCSFPPTVPDNVSRDHVETPISDHWLGKGTLILAGNSGLSHSVSVVQRSVSASLRFCEHWPSNHSSNHY